MTNSVLYDVLSIMSSTTLWVLFLFIIFSISYFIIFNYMLRREFENLQADIYEVLRRLKVSRIQQNDDDLEIEEVMD